jgi:nonribosomal peptide synthetase MxcG
MIMEDAERLELLTLAVFRDVLHMDSCSADDDFFELGGNSKQAVEIASRLSELLGVTVGPTLILHFPNAKELAESIRVL